MRSRARLLRDLIGASLYVVDERAVADAMLARIALRRLVAEPSLRSDDRGPAVRSFRRERGARSFRLEGVPSMRRPHF